MLLISKRSRLSPDEIIARASQFFGQSGEGLDETEHGSCCISFSGVGGFLTVMVYEKDNKREVEIETREFEYQAKQFLGLI